MSYAPLIPHTNATLTKVAGQGWSDDYEQPEGVDTDKWTGSHPVYVGQELLTDRETGEVNEITQAQLTVEKSLGIDFQRGDSITYVHEGTAATRRVRNLKTYDVTGLVKLHFEET